MALNKIIDFFTSLRLTVACLVAAMVLVFVGTLAQVNLGLYDAQARYFRSLFVMWSPGGGNLRIPVWPGGYLLGTVLLINLVAAHIRRFRFTRKKAGIFLIHAGLIFLLVGQFFTEVLQVESFVRFEEGETKRYSEDSRYNELAVIEVGSKSNKVVSIPESLLAERNEIQHPELPFTIRINQYLPNSWPTGPMAEGDKIRATEGAGAMLPFTPRPITRAMDDENKPLALLEIVTPDGKSHGTWTATLWFSKHPWPALLGEMMSSLRSVLAQPQQFEIDGRVYQIALRPIRYYKDHAIQLVDFTHDKYPGTERARNFQSDVRVINEASGEDRKVSIYMNNPLRYGGETYYQGSFDPGNDRVSVLQVVRNPAWLTPYVSCTLVGLGLVVQFMMHLVGFARRRPQQKLKGVQQAAAAGRKVKPQKLAAEPALAGAERKKN